MIVAGRFRLDHIPLSTGQRTREREAHMAGRAWVSGSERLVHELACRVGVSIRTLAINGKQMRATDWLIAIGLSGGAESVAPSRFLMFIPIHGGEARRILLVC
jgi:hypothetical protein